MGAGKSTALAAAREAGLETIEIDELIERELGMPIGEFFEREGEAEFRAREAEVVGCGCWSRPTAARSRSAAAACSRSGCARRWAPRRRLAPGRRRGGLAAGRAQRPPAGPRAPRTSRALLAARLPLYEELADAVAAAGRTRVVIARAMPSLLALLRSCRTGTRMVWAASASGDYPVFVGPGAARKRRVAACRGRRFCVTDTDGRRALLRARSSRSRRCGRGRAGRAAKTMAEAERRAAASWPTPE